MNHTAHHLTVTDQHGKQVRGRVVYLQPKGAGPLSFDWGALDEEESQPMRKAGVDLMQFQSVNQGY